MDGNLPVVTFVDICIQMEFVQKCNKCLSVRCVSLSLLVMNFVLCACKCNIFV